MFIIRCFIVSLKHLCGLFFYWFCPWTWRGSAGLEAVVWRPGDVFFGAQSPWSQCWQHRLNMMFVHASCQFTEASLMKFLLRTMCLRIVAQASALHRCVEMTTPKTFSRSFGRWDQSSKILRRCFQKHADTAVTLIYFFIKSQQLAQVRLEIWKIKDILQSSVFYLCSNDGSLILYNSHSLHSFYFYIREWSHLSHSHALFSNSHAISPLFIRLQYIHSISHFLHAISSTSLHIIVTAPLKSIITRNSLL